MITIIMKKLVQNNKKKVFFLMVKDFQFKLLSGKRTNCIDKNILRSAVGRNDRSAACSGEKKSVTERK